MPRRNGTGPEGKGPLTGRGLGVHGKNIPFNETKPLRNGVRRNGNRPFRNEKQERSNNNR